MRGCTKAEEPDAVAGLHARDAQTAKANDAGAQQRRGVQVVEFGRERINKIAARGGVLGISAVDGISGEDRRVAKILEATAAVRAVPSTPPIQDTPTRVPSGNSGVAPSTTIPTIWWPGISGLLSRRQFAFDDVQVGAADSAGAHAQQKLHRLAGLGLGASSIRRGCFGALRMAAFKKRPKRCDAFSDSRDARLILAGIPDVPCSRVTRAAVARNVFLSA